MAKIASPSTAAPSETEDSGTLLEDVGVVSVDGQHDIAVTVQSFRGAVSIRINRVGLKKGEPFVGKLGAIKTVEEATDLAKLLPLAAKALAKHLKA